MATLHPNVITKLEVFSGNKPLSTEIINTIQSSLELVSMLNLFNNRNGNFKLVKTGAFYNDYPKSAPIIGISNEYVGESFYLTLAHELGHATGLQQSKYIRDSEIDKKKPITYKNSIAYSDSRRIGEGEAIFKEHVVAKELNILSVFTKMKGQHITNILNDNNKTKKQKIAEIAKLNPNMIPSGQGNVVNPYTYDEKDIIWFISTFTNINSDYKEVLNKEFIHFDDETMDLHHKNTNIYHIKSLANRKNAFFAHNREDTDNTNDTLENKIGLASEAQKKGQHDVMYGGRGNDTITGAAGKEIILGGDGVDKLYGMGGDDILGGNIGDDHLYGGTGNDTLKGGQGMDTYYFEANDINNPKERDTINDSDNQGKILISNVDIAKAKWVNKGNGIW